MSNSYDALSFELKRLQENEWPKIIYESHIRQFIKQYVSGQDEMVNLLAFLGHLYTLNLNALHAGVRHQSLPKLNLFVSGPTGSGKTFIIKKFAEALGMEYKRIDCTSITGAGWKGSDLSDYLESFLAKSPLGFGIIHLDEFDKVAMAEARDKEMKLDLQSSLLDLLEGEYKYLPDTTNRSHRSNLNLEPVNNCLVIMTGSFQSYRKHIKDKNSMGFKEVDKEKHKLGKDWRKELSNMGFIQELAGRIVTALELEPYNVDQIRDIVVNTKESAYLKYQNVFKDEIRMDKEELEQLINEVSTSELGLRELDSIMFNKMYQRRLKNAK